MFDNLPTIYRFLLCLLFSVSVHGAAVFSDWGSSPADSPLVNAPVTVSLLPVSGVLPLVSEEKPQARPAPEPEAKKLQDAVSATPAKVTPVESKKPRKTLLESLPVLTAEVEEPLVASPGDEVCHTHQAVVCEGTSESAPVPSLAPVVEGQGTASDGGAVTAQRDAASPGGDVLQDEVAGAAALEMVEAVPNYRNNPLPEYPYLARQKRWEGVVWLLVDVSAEGLVDDLRVEESCGHRVLDRTARKTVSRWQFTPAKRAGIAVESQVRIPVRFRLEDG